jgi:hypothetical protein
MAVVAAIAEILASAVILVQDLNVVQSALKEGSVGLGQQIVSHGRGGTDVIALSLACADAADLARNLKPETDFDAVQRLLTEQRHRLQLMEKVVESASPTKILQRGYSITRCEGKVVRDASSLPNGSVLTTTLADGEVKSVVREF